MVGTINLAATIVLSGNNFANIALLARFLNMAFLIRSSFLYIQSHYIVPGVDEYWLDIKRSRFEQLRGKDVIVAGDGRLDSPGHCAKYCTYSILGIESRCLLEMVVIDKRETDSKSTCMEAPAFTRIIDGLTGAGVILKEIVTDAYSQITNIMKKKYPGILHSYEVWHGAKNLARKLTTAAAPNDCSKLRPWIKDITNHFWYCARECEGSNEACLSRWIGVIHHVAGCHDWAWESVNKTTSPMKRKPICLLTAQLTWHSEKLFCVNVDVSSGGSFKYSDFDGTYQGLKSFTPVVNKKVLCFKYDNVPPVHCSESNNCETNPLQLSSRVTKSGKVTVTVTGWTDPIPDNGTKAQASGIDYFKINVYGVKHLDPKTLEIDYNTPVSSSKNLEGDFSIRINLRDQPQMYVTYLETHDVAVNVRFSRRFLLYDNESKLVTMDNKSFCFVSASEDTKCRWQIHHGNISLDWKDRFYNDFYIQNNYFVPIKADTGNSVVGVYEQLTGVLPVSGTKSVNGVTGFSYQWSRNNGTKTRWMNVPDFTKQEMSLNLPVKDGETYEVWIKAQDIMVNTVVESVIVHIDRSMADIAYTWFVREGTNQIYVHNDTDLSKMVFQFRAFDVHSGITSVQWSVGIANAASDIGTGALPVIKLDGEFICQSNINCYCPDVGPCEYQNYTLTLNSLVASNTNRGYNGEYDITPCVTNGAILKSFDHLVFLVNDSRPVVDTIEAGTTGSGLYIGTGLGVVLLVGLVTAVLVILKRKKKICYSKHQKDVVRYNAAPGNTTYDSITRGGDQAQQYETLGSLTLPPAPGNKTYETLTRENDQTQPYMSLRFVVKADAPKNPAYETLTRENDQAQLYMNMGCLGQAAKPNKST